MAEQGEKAPEAYSTNPNTVRSRTRKKRLQGEAKIQDAARTADYKAMLYARNAVREKPEYKAASDMAQKAMLEDAMRDTMEKRRLKGQDTMSKMAAYHAGQYSYRAMNKGPATTVPIMPFLKSNGYVPLQSPSTNPHPSDLSAGPSATPGTSTDFDPDAPAATVTMAAAGDPFGAAGAEILNSPFHNEADDRLGTPTSAHTSFSFSPHNRRVTLDGAGGSDRLSTASPSVGMDPGHLNLLNSPGVMPMAPELSAQEAQHLSYSPSMPADGGGGSGSSQRLACRVGALHSAVERLATSGSVLRGDLDTISAGLGGVRTDVGLVRAELTLHKARADGLEERLGRLETGMRGLTQGSVPRVQEQMSRLEQAVVELQRNVGGGADAEITKMRSVMRALQDALKEAGGY